MAHALHWEVSRTIYLTAFFLVGKERLIKQVVCAV